MYEITPAEVAKTIKSIKENDSKKTVCKVSCLALLNELKNKANSNRGVLSVDVIDTITQETIEMLLNNDL
jgi:aspartyl/asparaginyl beta-hydroxylase (cupin superfamily)